MILGKPHDDVNKIMDGPYKWLGRKHRLLLHDVPSILFLFGDNPEKLAAASLHLFLDKACNNKKTRKLFEAAFK